MKEDYLYLCLNKNFDLQFPLLNFISSNDIKNEFISELFLYSDSSIKAITNLIDNNWAIVAEYSQWLFTDMLPTKNKITKIIKPYHNYTNVITLPGSLRLISDYYKSDCDIPLINITKDSIITYFEENVNQCSDEWGKCPKSHKTYMIWSNEDDYYRITLLPTNKKYSKYIFFVNTSVCTLEVASYVIWRYFTSDSCNKRQGFQLTPLFKLFGIYHLHKS